MKKIFFVIIGTLIIILIVFLIYKFFWQKNYLTSFRANPTVSMPLIVPTSPTFSAPSTSSTSVYNLAEPVADFKARITKKPFGIYITPENSSIQPEKFTGYHIGIDVEYEDITDDTSVYSILDGEVIQSGFISGYGGFMAIKHQYNNQDIISIYGHLNLTNSPKAGEKVQKNQQIAILGKNKSTETDGERKHLHFAILKGDTIDFRGYVQNESELSNWSNPLGFY